jgi:hypothetical protein
MLKHTREFLTRFLCVDVIAIVHKYTGCDVCFDSTPCSLCLLASPPFTCILDKSRTTDPQRLSLQNYIQETHGSWKSILVFLDLPSSLETTYREIGDMLQSLQSQCTLSIARCNNDQHCWEHYHWSKCHNLVSSITQSVSSSDAPTLIVMEDHFLWKHYEQTMKRSFFSDVRTCHKEVSIIGIIPNRWHLCRLDLSIDLVSSLDDFAAQSFSTK